ncbi:threonine/serine exporter family protein [Prescottella soli]|uniref:Threonine/serine exporter family protein n=1 Tax=Prescottella soli TaxID=1543852 RepID=A0ABW9FNS6_9NOCA
MRRFAASIGSLVKDRRATVDTVTAAPTPLQPIDLTDDARVAEVLDLAVRIGDLLLASGTSAVDTATQVRFVAATYGLAQCDVDVTYNSIVLSAHRGPLIPPASTMRIVHYRSMDFTRLAAADRLTRRIRLEAITPAQAHAALDAIVSAPHPYNRWIATLGWAGVAAAVAVLLGAGPFITIVAFLTTVVIDRVNRVLNRFGLPYFFQQMMGGLIAATPAMALYAVRDHLGVEVRPSLIIAAGVVVLLSGLSLVGSVQDAITGAPITASARFFEVVMMTGGIIAGVALSLRVASALGADLPLISNVPPPDITQLPVKVIAGALTSMFFALACYAERRALTAAGLGGAAGLLFFVLAQSMGIGPVISSAIAATVVGFAGGLMARRALTPPLVVAVAGITPLLPGLSLYRGLYAMLNDEVIVGLTALLGAFGVGCALAAGVTLGEWGARTLRRPPRRRNATLRRNTTLRRPRFGRRSVTMSNSVSDSVTRNVT